MRTRTGIGAMICLAAVMALNPSLTAAARADSADLARSVFDGVRSNLQAIPPLSMDVEVTKFKIDNDRYTREVPIERLVKQYRQKGDRLDLVSTRYAPDESGAFVDDNFTGRSIWDGQRAMHRQGGGPKYTLGFISKSDDLSRRILFCDDGGKILDGFIPHNMFEGPWPDVLEKQLDRVHIRPQTEAVNGHACQVLEAETRYGPMRFGSMSPTAAVSGRR
jgi:hypothetical protein